GSAGLGLATITITWLTSDIGYPRMFDLTAGTDEAGHAFQFEAGRVFRSEAGHPWRQSHGSI
ncbi:MAG TPA: hypothetical protein VMT08_13510, partial [Bradyrhizobium sp.]|nr:hypothetical protein [Bradyrhizobium sp.]